MSKSQYRGVWVLGEQEAGRVARITHELIARGRSLADKRCTELTVLIFGHELENAALTSLLRRGADAVLAVQARGLEHFLVEPYAACMLDLLSKRRPEIVLAGATTTGRTLMPYVAAKARAGLTADCTELDIDDKTGGLLQTRPAIGGNILATIETPACRPQMATVRPRSTHPAEPRPDRTGGRIEIVTPGPEQLRSRVRRVGVTMSSEEHTLQDADIVVTAGRGIRKAANLPVVQELSESLGGALGASREVVDRGWLSYPHQVGLSGKTVTPRLYVSVGVSGAIQHLAGMQTSEHIIAVNSDPDAPIFRVAELGIVGDLFEVLPVLARKIRAARSESTER